MIELRAPQAETQDKELRTSPVPQFPAVFIFKQPPQSPFSSYQDEYKKDLMLQGISVLKKKQKQKHITWITNADLNVIFNFMIPV